MTLRRLGDPSTAAMLLNHYSGVKKRAPKGFRKIGEGVSRTAILEVATGIVYKVGDSNDNENEAFTAALLRRSSNKKFSGFTLKIPFTYPYDLDKGMVLAQEYAANARFTNCSLEDSWFKPDAKCTCKRYSAKCFTDIHSEVSDYTGLADIHCENLLLDKNGVYWLIDMAN